MNFKDLKVWSKAHSLALANDGVFKDMFAKSEEIGKMLRV